MHKNYIFSSETGRNFSVLPEIMFIQYTEGAKNLKRKIHVHEFWQLEAVSSGVLEISFRNGKLSAGENGLILIPPGIPHHFSYPGREWGAWSIKFSFQTEHVPPGVITFSLSEEGDAVFKALSGLSVLEKPDARRRARLEYSLGLFLETELGREREAGFSAKVESIIMMIDNSGGKPLSVNDIARRLNCSRNNVSASFRKETGTGLKEFIDRKRVETAENLLEFTDMRITEAASVLGFPDVYSFSRFFRRMNGASPRIFSLKRREGV
jgi:AraC family transcriptional activator of pobA